MEEKGAWRENGHAVNKLGFPCLTYTKAIEYIESGNSCLEEIEKQRQVGLSPRYIGQVDVGIRETLDADLLQYSEDLDGIIVCYKQVRCLDTSGCIIDETPFLHFNVVVNYIVFRPRVGTKLIGTVNRVGHNHYGCLVHGCFNASIHKLKTDTLKHDKKTVKRISKIDVGSEFVFRITRIDVHNEILSIKGKIDPEDLHTIRNHEQELTNIKQEFPIKVEKEEIQLSTAKSPSKKKKKDNNILLNGIISTTGSKDANISPLKQNQTKLINTEETNENKKKKKRRHSEILQNIKIEKHSDEEMGNSTESVISKKKKRKSKD